MSRDTRHPNRIASLPKGENHWNYNPQPSILALHKRIHRKHGAAEAQRLQQETLTPQLLRKMELENQARAIEKWDGKQPTTVAGNNGLLFNIPTGR